MSELPPGYEMRAAFQGAEPRCRPKLSVVAALLEEFWSLRHSGSLSEGGMIIEYTDATRGIQELWVVADNGGELNVQRINDAASLRSVPYEQDRCVVPIGRLAWFCALVMRGESIEDYGPNPGVDDLLPSTLNPSIRSNRDCKGSCRGSR